MTLGNAGQSAKYPPPPSLRTGTAFLAAPARSLTPLAIPLERPLHSLQST
jgi:hypothetical protein